MRYKIQSHCFYIKLKFWGSIASFQNPLVIGCSELPRGHSLIQRVKYQSWYCPLRESTQESMLCHRKGLTAACCTATALQTADITWALSPIKCSPGKQGVSWGQCMVTRAHTELSVWWPSIQVQSLPVFPASLPRPG